MSGDIRSEWRITDIERAINRIESRIYELDILSNSSSSQGRAIDKLENEIESLIYVTDDQQRSIDLLIERIEYLERES